MTTLGIVPARMASTRFPGKPMADIAGMPMVGHCYLRSLLSESIDTVWVATCDEEIDRYIRGLGGGSVMTSDRHERASDRAAEALLRIEQITGTTYDRVVLIQGDEPLLAPAMLDELVDGAKKREGAKVVNLIASVDAPEEFHHPNTVKIVTDRRGQALYFSRAPIPSGAKYDGRLPMWKQLGVILFSRDALLAYPALEPTQLEIVESVDMNRFLEHGWPIDTVRTAHASQAVDTPEDLAVVRRLMEGDELFLRYRRRPEGTIQ